ncbi:hypothetical protein Taro_032863, partial [Colocasia esculenta]|nr:hypothetical protein [Colocasia esculenta]
MSRRGVRSRSAEPGAGVNWEAGRDQSIHRVHNASDPGVATPLRSRRIVPSQPQEAKNDGKCAPFAYVDVHMTSAVEGQAVDQDVKCIIDCGDISKLIGKRVRLVDIEMKHVVDGILISTEIEKVVMGRKIDTEYCE